MLPEGIKRDLKLGVTGFFIGLSGGLIDFLGFYLKQRPISFLGFFITAGGILIGWFAMGRGAVNSLRKKPEYQVQEPSYEDTANAMQFYSGFVVKTVLVLCSIIVILYFVLKHYFND